MPDSDSASAAGGSSTQQTIQQSEKNRVHRIADMIRGVGSQFGEDVGGKASSGRDTKAA